MSVTCGACRWHTSATLPTPHTSLALQGVPGASAYTVRSQEQAVSARDRPTARPRDPGVSLTFGGAKKAREESTVSTCERVEQFVTMGGFSMVAYGSPAISVYTSVFGRFPHKLDRCPTFYPTYAALCRLASGHGRVGIGSPRLIVGIAVIGHALSSGRQERGLTRHRLQFEYNSAQSWSATSSRR
jgi:hypothetical protein